MKIENIKFDKVKFLDGFWKNRYDLNLKTSIYAVKKVFESSGRFNAVRFIEGNKNIHVYYDSDVAKWIEAVAYILAKHREEYADLEAFCDELIASIVAHQREDGYFNSYFQQVEPTQVFKRRNDHELYCAGHLIEAAIAYDQYTGKDALLGVVKRYVSCIRKAFMVEKTAEFVTCGHQEIELALFKLYEYTSEEKYRELACFFIDQRGANDVDKIISTDICTQDNLPARELSKATGHAVRAMYYYSAMADMARIENDEALWSACLRLFDDIVNHKMYITGGLGSTRIGEALTQSYDLPNLTAYAESCAGIGLVLFCLRLNALGIDGRYADVIERVLYNVFLSSTSLNGKAFFYENPLEICRKEKGKETSTPEEYRPLLPIWRRQEVFNCSCCPPNINRFVASLANVIYTRTEEGVYINQYISSILEEEGISVETSYPAQTEIKINAVGYRYGKLYVRVPGWCNNYMFTVGGKRIKVKVVNGYAEISVVKDAAIILHLDFSPKFIMSNPQIRVNAGKVCLVNGPMVYCLEEIDNGADLFALSVSPETNSFGSKLSEIYQMPVFTVQGERLLGDTAPLYADTYKKEEVTLTFIPYFAFANRKESDMLVWINMAART